MMMVGFLVFLVIGVYLLVSNLRLKDILKKEMDSKTVNQDADLEKQRELKRELKKSLEEKYRADIVSYQVAAKRLKREQERLKALEQKNKIPANGGMKP